MTIDLPPFDLGAALAHMVIFTTLVVNVLQIRTLTTKLNGHLKEHQK